MLIIGQVRLLARMQELRILMKPMEFMFYEQMKKTIRLRSKNKKEVVMC